MKRILLAVVAVALGVLAVVFLRPSREVTTSPPLSAATDGSNPVEGASRPALRPPVAPPEGRRDREDHVGPDLTTDQKRAMHRLIQSYQRAQRMVGEVESSEAVQRDLERQRYATDVDGIRAAINSQIPNIEECYESWLGLNPTLEGRIVTNFAIEAKEGGDGAGVVGVNVREGGLGNKFLEGCVLSVFSDLEFEVPADGRMEVNYPFTFRLRGSEE